MEKREIYSQPKFRQIISLETSLVNTLFSRKLCPKCERLKIHNFQSVRSCTVVATSNYLEKKINDKSSNEFHDQFLEKLALEN